MLTLRHDAKLGKAGLRRSSNFRKVTHYYTNLTLFKFDIHYNMHHSNECKHVNCCAWNWGWSVSAEYTSACIHLVSLHYILLYKIHSLTFGLCTHTHMHIHTRTQPHMSTTVINRQDVRCHWQKKEEKYRKLHALEICLTSVLKQTTRLYTLTIIGMYMLN